MTMGKVVALGAPSTFVIVANWKAAPQVQTWGQSVGLAVDFAQRLKTLEAGGKLEGVEVGVFPPQAYLDRVASALNQRNVKPSLLWIGAQNIYHQEGAFTGEVPLTQAEHILGSGANVMVGHSERRHVFGERNAMIAAKLRAAIDHGFRPTLCVGETIGQRNHGKTKAVLRRQMGTALENISAERVLGSRLIVAYEPVWAIGTGKTATAADANAACFYIRQLLARKYGVQVAEQIHIQYGGSAKPSNAFELLRQKHINGLLVGGASLDPNSFIFNEDAEFIDPALVEAACIVYQEALAA